MIDDSDYMDSGVRGSMMCLSMLSKGALYAVYKGNIEYSKMNNVLAS